MKFKKFIKLSIAITLALCLSISTNAAAIAQTVSMPEEIAELNRINAPKYAISFINKMFDNPGLQSGNVNEILDEYDRVSGYCVDLVNGDVPSGYVIIDIASTQPVVMDFCIEPNAQNPYKTIEKTFELSVNEELYYSFAPFDYQIYVPQDNVIAGIKGQTELTQSFETYKANIAAKKISRLDEQKLNGINELNSDDKYSGVTAVITSTYQGKYVDGDEIYRAKNVVYYSQSQIESLNFDYCCGIAFACNLMKYYHDARGMTAINTDLSVLYPVLYSGAGAKLGAVEADDAVDSALVYLDSVGYHYKYGKYWLKLYSDYKRDVKKDQPSMFNYGAWGIFQHEAWHGVLVLGYLESDMYQYLLVADGWNTFPRYLNYSGSSFINHYGGTFYAA